MFSSLADRSRYFLRLRHDILSTPDNDVKALSVHSISNKFGFFVPLSGALGNTAEVSLRHLLDFQSIRHLRKLTTRPKIKDVTGTDSAWSQVMKLWCVR